MTEAVDLMRAPAQFSRQLVEPDERLQIACRSNYGTMLIASWLFGIKPAAADRGNKQVLAGTPGTLLPELSSNNPHAHNPQK